MLVMKEKDLQIAEKDLQNRDLKLELSRKDLQASNGQLMRLQGLLHCRGLLEAIEKRGGKKDNLSRLSWWSDYLANHTSLEEDIMAATGWSAKRIPHKIYDLMERSSDKIHRTTRTLKDAVVIYTDHWSLREVGCWEVLCEHRGVAAEKLEYGLQATPMLRSKHTLL
eukprot:TRINITY_DN503_c0_g1_i1.p2 TRINITY_DN503_c0_g1~~TRINITY_DN503_c0_g1_i1.p2  ORF type:complete len:167 (-),score=23.25 TRINITY_DN503_c0_g1_i1:79-579(-)